MPNQAVTWFAAFTDDIKMVFNYTKELTQRIQKWTLENIEKKELPKKIQKWTHQNTKKTVGIVAAVTTAGVVAIIDPMPHASPLVKFGVDMLIITSLTTVSIIWKALAEQSLKWSKRLAAKKKIKETPRTRILRSMLNGLWYGFDLGNALALNILLNYSVIHYVNNPNAAPYTTANFYPSYAAIFSASIAGGVAICGFIGLLTKKLPNFVSDGFKMSGTSIKIGTLITAFGTHFSSTNIANLVTWGITVNVIVVSSLAVVGFGVGAVRSRKNQWKEMRLPDDSLKPKSSFTHIIEFIDTASPVVANAKITSLVAGIRAISNANPSFTQDQLIHYALDLIHQGRGTGTIAGLLFTLNAFTPTKKPDPEEENEKDPLLPTHSFSNNPAPSLPSDYEGSSANTNNSIFKCCRK